MQKQSVIEIQPLKLGTLVVHLIGDTPLIVHAWSQKAKLMMLNKQMKKATSKKEAKDPEQDFRDSLYVISPGVYGFPAKAFKSAAVSACRSVDSIKMTEAKASFHVVGGELLQIRGSEPTMREDMVRVGMGTADIRYRGEFKRWAVEVPVQFNTAMLSPAQIVNLFNVAGFGAGIGEHRPEKSGSNGMFHVAVNGEEKEYGF